MSFNLQIIAGNVGKEPDVRYTPSGDAVTTFSVATSKRWTKDGERQEKTTWHRVVCFRKLAEIMAEHLQKGALVLVQGETEHQEYSDKNTGEKRYSTQIIAANVQLLGGKSNQDNQGGQQRPAQKRAPVAGSMPEGGGGGFDDDIPFHALHSYP